MILGTRNSGPPRHSMGKSGFHPASAPMMPQRMALGAAAVAALLRRAQFSPIFTAPKWEKHGETLFIHREIMEHQASLDGMQRPLQVHDTRKQK